MPRVRWMILAACILVATGCSGGNSEKKPKAPKGTAAPVASETAAPPEVDANSGLDLDGNRVRVFSPKGWRRAPKSYDYLVRYQAKSQVAYPSVVVVATDVPEGFTAVTAENHKDFVAAVAARLVKEFGGEGRPSLTQPPEAVTVGSHAAVTWKAPGQAKLDGGSKEIERECTAVVVGGRMYTVEVWALPGKIDSKAKEAARSVAQTLAVPSINSAEPLIPFGSPPPTDPEPAAAPESDAKSNPAAT